MGWFSGDTPNPEESYQRVYEEPEKHEGHFSHELVGGAAAFMAMRMYEQRQAAEGKPPSHQFAKEMLAGIVGGEVDKLVETRGMDYMDAERAKAHARKEAEHMYDNRYSGDQLDGSGGMQGSGGGMGQGGYGGAPGMMQGGGMQGGYGGGGMQGGMMQGGGGMMQGGGGMMGGGGFPGGEPYGDRREQFGGNPGQMMGGGGPGGQMMGGGGYGPQGGGGGGYGGGGYGERREGGGF